MTSITVTLHASQPPAPQVDAGLLTLRKYGDKRMAALMGLDTNFIQTGNFQNIVFYTPQGGFGAVTQFQPMDAQALNYLERIQPIDAVEVKRKLNWLGTGATSDNPNGRPYIFRNGMICWGTMGFGGQKIRVAVDANGQPIVTKFVAKYQQTQFTETIEFFTVAGMRRADMARPVSELITEGLIQHATEAFMNPPNTYNDHPQGGVILNPVWSPLDWPSNHGNVLYLAKAFCEEF